MLPGAKLMITIPYKEAFGAAGIPGLVPPYATILARVEVLEVCLIELCGALKVEAGKLQDLFDKGRLAEPDLIMGIAKLREEQRKIEEARTQESR